MSAAFLRYECAAPLMDIIASWLVLTLIISCAVTSFALHKEKVIALCVCLLGIPAFSSLFTLMRRFVLAVSPRAHRRLTVPLLDSADRRARRPTDHLVFGECVGDHARLTVRETP